MHEVEREWAGCGVGWGKAGGGEGGGLWFVLGGGVWLGLVLHRYIENDVRAASQGRREASKKSVQRLTGRKSAAEEVSYQRKEKRGFQTRSAELPPIHGGENRAELRRRTLAQRSNVLHEVQKV